MYLKYSPITTININWKWNSKQDSMESEKNYLRLHAVIDEKKFNINEKVISN